MNPGKIILYIVLLLVVFLIGGVAGVMYQSQNTPAVQQQVSQPANQTTPPIIKQLSSKVFPSIIAYGQVVSINGQTVTLSYGGDTSAIKMKDGATIYSFSLDSKGKLVQKKVDFSQIKTGNSVNINSLVLPDGTLQGQSAIILPASANLPAK